MGMTKEHAHLGFHGFVVSEPVRVPPRPQAAALAAISRLVRLSPRMEITSTQEVEHPCVLIRLTPKEVPCPNI
jgi:hypothetical protein